MTSDDKAADQGDDTAGTTPGKPMVPAAEIVYVPRFPAHAEQVTAQVGEDVSEEALTLSAGPLAVTGRLTALERQQVKRGQSVVITSSRTGAEVKGKVTHVASQPTKATGQEEQAGGEEHFAIEIEPREKLEAEWVGQNVRLTIESASSKREVLAVPSAAVSSQANGRTTVTVKSSEGTRRINVSVGMSADGFVQVTPLEKDALKAGDAVVVGARAEAP